MYNTYDDEDIINLRQKLYEYNDNVDKVANKLTNDINNGYIVVEGREIKFTKRIIEDKIEIILPSIFEQMEEAYVDLKYRAYKTKNKIIITNEQTDINFIFDFTENIIEKGQLELASNQLLRLLQKAKPTLILVKKSIVKTNFLDIAYFEIVTPAFDKDIYNFMYFFTIKNKLVVATFNCFDDEKNYWQPIIKQIIETIEIIE